MDLTRGHIDALREQKVGSGEADRVLVVDQVLRVLRRSSAEERDDRAGLREAVHGGKSVGSRVNGRADLDRERASHASGVFRDHELLERTSGLAGLRVDGEHAADGEHVTNLERGRRGTLRQNDSRGALS